MNTFVAFMPHVVKGPLDEEESRFVCLFEVLGLLVLLDGNDLEVEEVFGRDGQEWLFGFNIKIKNLEIP